MISPWELRLILLIACTVTTDAKTFIIPSSSVWSDAAFVWNYLSVQQEVDFVQEEPIPRKGWGIQNIVYNDRKTPSFKRRTNVSLLSSVSSSIIPPPPPISVPVWSLAVPLARDGDNIDVARRRTTATSMNVVTFATPVSVATPKLWIVSLFYNTLTMDSFMNHGYGVLQLLTPSHRHLVPILGKHSGYDAGYNKRDECKKLGYGWVTSDCSVWVDGTTDATNSSNDGLKPTSMELIPGCASYILLKKRQQQPKLISELDANDHLVVLCEVISTSAWDYENKCIRRQSSLLSPLDSKTVLYSGLLREEGII